MERHGAATGRGTLCIILLLSLAARTGWPQALDQGELGTTAGRLFAFDNFAGPYPEMDSLDPIVEIGRELARSLGAGGSRGDYFGKYSAIRAFDPDETVLLSADIIILGNDARVRHIRNVQRIVEGYLEVAFGYGPAESDRLAALVIDYNAAYRGNTPALSRRYTSLVMSHLNADNAGIALSYTEWPGRTRLVVPLERAAGGEAERPAATGGVARPPAGAGAGTEGTAPNVGGSVGSEGRSVGGGRGGEGGTGGGVSGGGGTGGVGGGPVVAQPGGPRQLLQGRTGVPQGQPPTAFPPAASGPSTGPTAASSIESSAAGTGTPTSPTPSPAGSAVGISSGSPAAGSAPGTAATESATVEFPSGVISGGKRLPVLFVIHSASPHPLVVRLLSVRLADGTELLRRAVSVRVPPQGSATIRAVIQLPDSMTYGRQSLPVELGVTGRLPVSPTSGILSIDYTAQTGVSAGAFWHANALWILLVAALLILAVVVRAILRARPLRMGRRPPWARLRQLSARGGHPLVEMVVTTQNRHIGYRNVHYLRPGSSASVGGGRSAFLVYFVKVPPRMALLTYDGRTYTFVPVKTDLFPDLGGPVPNCLGKEIAAKSPRGHRFIIVFRKYLSPLDEINRLMRSVGTGPSK